MPQGATGCHSPPQAATHPGLKGKTPMPQDATARHRPPSILAQTSKKSI